MKHLTTFLVFWLVIIAALPGLAKPPRAGEKVQRVLSLLRDRSIQAPRYDGLVRAARDGALREWKQRGGQELDLPLEQLLEQHPELEEAALRAAVEQLHDHYSTYLSADDFAQLLESLEADSSGGVGLYVVEDASASDGLLVLDVAEGSPAQKAGILVGDVVLAVNGKGSHELGVNAVRSMLGGQPGTAVALRMRRQEGRREVSLQRQRLAESTVSYRLLRGASGQNIGYIRIRVFGNSTPTEVARALKALRTQNLAGMVLDLRNNGGGYLEAAVETCSLLMPAGRRVVSVVTRDGSAVGHDTHSPPGWLFSPPPLVVLVNEHTASAAEITTAALREHRYCQVVGHRSFGKATVQNIIQLDDGSALKLTTARYRTAAGADIDGRGLDPDLIVTGTLTQLWSSTDPQLDQALRLLAPSSAVR